LQQRRHVLFPSPESSFHVTWSFGNFLGRPSFPSPRSQNFSSHLFFSYDEPHQFVGSHFPHPVRLILFFLVFRIMLHQPPPLPFSNPHPADRWTILFWTARPLLLRRKVFAPAPTQCPLLFLSPASAFLLFYKFILRGSWRSFFPLD